MRKLGLYWLLCCGFWANAHALTPVSNVCDTQVRNYVENVLGLHIRSIQWDFSPFENVRGGSAWVSVDSCRGNIVVNLDPMADRYTCFEQVYYGTVPNFIASVYATGDCRVR